MVAFNYPNAPTRTCSGDFRVGFSYVSFTHVHCWLNYQVMMLDSFCPILKCLTTHILPSCPRSEDQKQPITRAGGNTFEGPTILPHV